MNAGAGLAILVTMSGKAAPGDLDLTFAGTGKLQIGFGFGNDVGRAAALEPDGRLVVAGYSDSGDSNPRFALVRYDTNNVLDPSFGVGGKVFTSIGNSSATLTDIKIQVDGKIVAVGSAYIGTNDDFVVVRYNLDGSLDSSFGDGGVVTTDFGLYDDARTLLIQADGKIVAAGITYAFAGDGAFAIARYNTNGTLDTTWNGTGKVTTQFHSNGSATAMLQQGDGKLLVAGDIEQFGIARYTTNGTLDTTFNGTGKVELSITGTSDFSGINAIAIQPGNNSIFQPDTIVVAGYAERNSQYMLALARYNFDGTLDTNFNGKGYSTNVVGSYAFPFGVIVQGSGFQAKKIVVGGYCNTGTNTQFFLARFLANGAFDSTFDGDGKVFAQVGSQDSEAYDLIFQAGGLLLTGSTATGENNSDFALARFSPTDGSRDTNFHGSGMFVQDVGDRTSEAKAVVVQADGKLVVAGSANDGKNDRFAVTRLNPDGSLDNSFGAGGKMALQVGSQACVAAAALVQPDGKTVVAGYAYVGTNQSFCVLRLLTNGVLDTGFGSNGIAIATFGATNATPSAIIIQPDGKLVVTGSLLAANNSDFAAARFNSNGSLDTSFGVNGKATTAVGAGNDQSTGAGLQSDGKIVLSGVSDFGPGTEMSLIRYQTNGMLDMSFGSFGRVATEISPGSVDGSFGMKIQPNGRIVVVGYTYTLPAADVDVALVRYNPGGTLDMTFDSDGKVITPIGLGAEYATSVSLRGDGKIVAGVAVQIGGALQFATVRYNSDGSLDSNYGVGGKAVLDFGTGAAETEWASALDSSDRSVLVGSAGGLFGVARLQGDPILRITSISRLPNGHTLLQGTGVPSAAHTLQSSSSLASGGFGPLAPVTADSSGAWQYEDAAAAAQRFYRLSLP